MGTPWPLAFSKTRRKIDETHARGRVMKKRTNRRDQHGACDRPDGDAEQDEGVGERSYKRIRHCRRTAIEGERKRIIGE